MRLPVATAPLPPALRSGTAHGAHCPTPTASKAKETGAVPLGEHRPLRAAPPGGRCPAGSAPLPAAAPGITPFPGEGPAQSGQGHDLGLTPWETAADGVSSGKTTLRLRVWTRHLRPHARRTGTAWAEVAQHTDTPVSRSQAPRCLHTGLPGTLDDPLVHPRRGSHRGLGGGPQAEDPNPKY